MPPRKLSELDKQNILTRYRQSEETTATLAAQYGVSTSTVSRILKQSLPEKEYEALVQQKRLAAFRGQPEQDSLPGLLAESEVELAAVAPAPPEAQDSKLDALEADEETQDRVPPSSSSYRRQRKRSNTKTSADFIEDAEAIDTPASVQLDLPTKKVESPQIDRPVISPKPETLPTRANDFDPILAAAELVSSEPTRPGDTEDFAEPEPKLEDEDLDDEDLDDEDLDDEDLDDEDLDDEDLDDEGSFPDDLGAANVQVQGRGLLQVLPLSDATVPKICYVVVDRTSELITRPLKDFADLGRIPTEETQSKILPIFDNHRVAKRFVRRMQRIIKVPDGQVFHKVGPYLQAKGITRLLIDGQVYSLEGEL